MKAEFAITLYVPDAIVRALGERCGLRGSILDGVPELDFLPPPGWWERSHAARLGLVVSEATNEPECEDNTEAGIRMA